MPVESSVDRCDGINCKRGREAASQSGNGKVIHSCGRIRASGSIVIPHEIETMVTTCCRRQINSSMLPCILTVVSAQKLCMCCGWHGGTGGYHCRVSQINLQIIITGTFTLVAPVEINLIGGSTLCKIYVTVSVNIGGGVGISIRSAIVVGDIQCITSIIGVVYCGTNNPFIGLCSINQCPFAVLGCILKITSERKLGGNLTRHEGNTLPVAHIKTAAIGSYIEIIGSLSIQTGCIIESVCNRKGRCCVFVRNIC